MGLPEITRTLFASRVALYTIRRGARGFGKIQPHRISSRLSYDASPWMDAKKTSAAPHAAKPPRWRQLAEGFSLHARWSAGADGGMGATSSVAGMSL